MSMETDKSLKAVRDRIDAIDENILRLINDRLSAAQTIAQIKDSQDEPAFYRPEREAQVLSRLKKLNTGLLEDRVLESLFREIMSITRSTQTTLTVSILGPLGAYSEAAARQHFGSGVSIVDFPIIDEVFKSTENGQTDFSVAPVENSTEGGVTGTLDRLITTSLTICGEIHFEDEPGSATRFLVLSNRAALPSGNDKTSLLLSCRSRPGALVHLLKPLLDERIDMTRIESRPSRISLWDYVFFVDFIGHEDEEHVGRALSEIRTEAVLYKSLGSYPASIPVPNPRSVANLP